MLEIKFHLSCLHYFVYCTRNQHLILVLKIKHVSSTEKSDAWSYPHVPTHHIGVGTSDGSYALNKVAWVRFHISSMCFWVSFFIFVLIESLINGYGKNQIKFQRVTISFEKLVFCFSFLFDFFFISENIFLQSLKSLPF